MNSKSDTRTLYDRLGGVYAIATVIDDFIDRVMSNPTLNANPAVDEAITASAWLGSSIWLQRWFAGHRGDLSVIAGVRCATPMSNSKSRKPSGPLSAKISMTPWPNLAFQTPRRTNSLPSCKARRVTSSPAN
jgi:hypothetical protein